MPTFHYSARDASGGAQQGSLEAPTRRDAVRLLSARGLTPVSVTEGAAARPAGANTKKRKDVSISSIRAVGVRFKRSLQLPFLSALSELINAGVPVGDGVRILGTRLQDPHLRALAGALWTSISEGASIARAMASIPEVFEEMTVNLVEAGEATGNLRDILPRLTEHYTRIAEIRTKLLTALAYPVFILFVAFGVIIFFLYFLLPNMQALFEALRGEMPWSTQLLINGSQFALKWGPFLVIAAVIAAISLWQWRRTPAGRLASDRLLLRMPLIGPFLVGADMLQATQTLSVLLANGITTIEALRLTTANVSNRALRETFQETRTRVSEGSSISGALALSPYIPRMDLDLIAIGEQTGNIIPSLRNIALSYQRRQARAIQGFLGTFSTVLLVAVFLFVGFLAYAIVSSVFGLSASFGR
jgi:type II secretory pathway component PulF